MLINMALTKGKEVSASWLMVCLITFVLLAGQQNFALCLAVFMHDIVTGSKKLVLESSLLQVNVIGQMAAFCESRKFLAWKSLQEKGLYEQIYN